jgi:hypothetical protein
MMLHVACKFLELSFGARASVLNFSYSDPLPRLLPVEVGLVLTFVLLSTIDNLFKLF